MEYSLDMIAQKIAECAEKIEDCKREISRLRKKVRELSCLAVESEDDGEISYYDEIY